MYKGFDRCLLVEEWKNMFLGDCKVKNCLKVENYSDEWIIWWCDGCVDVVYSV